MTNHPLDRIEKTAETLAPHLAEFVGEDDLDVATSLMEVLAEEGWLQSQPGSKRIIRTAEELKELDPDTVLMNSRVWFHQAELVKSSRALADSFLPAVALAAGENVRDAREALGELNG